MLLQPRNVFIRISKKRIYQSKGKISLEHGNFIIQGTEYPKKTKNIKIQLFFCISKTNKNSPQAHKRVLNQLHELATIATNVSRYTFGKQAQDTDKNFFLNINNFIIFMLKNNMIKNFSIGHLNK
ncbi:hypothetical protein [Acinetobacter sp.]|uniref:hypothetical protein n=1 Tax=Acinetobacter sp. TaxID=472 RepID=UPI002FCB25A8